MASVFSSNPCSAVVLMVSEFVGFFPLAQFLYFLVY
uniref:Uncharacterized protein n=1 Tax=Rhizophora mucronata TaxID=61149 RepID=A0A2P2N7T8_RHIMU